MDGNQRLAPTRQIGRTWVVRLVGLPCWHTSTLLVVGWPRRGQTTPVSGTQ